MPKPAIWAAGGAAEACPYLLRLQPRRSMEMDVQGLDYLISSVSLLLLGVSPLKTAMDDPLILACLAGGVTLSILGMVLRYTSHRHDQHERRKMGRMLEYTRRQVEEPVPAE